MELQFEAGRWLEAAFPGAPGNKDVRVRALRHVEEAIELAQAAGLSAENVLAQVHHTYGRPVGDLVQEVAGSLITLVMVADALGVDALRISIAELESAWDRIDQIRAKNQSKIKVAVS